MSEARPPPKVRELDLTDLYQRHGRAVYRRCQYFLRDNEAAQDAMHDIFVKVVERHHAFRGASSPLTWIVSITTNHCLNVIRGNKAKWKQRYQRTVEVDSALRGPKDVEQLEQRHLILDLLTHIGRVEQEAAIYYWVDEMNQTEAAEAAGCSVPTLRKRLRGFLKSAEHYMHTSQLGSWKKIEDD